MSLYLCVFRDGSDLEGVDCGAYSDFNFFREFVTQNLEHGDHGARFPVLINHSDSDGEWSPVEAEELAGELRIISAELRTLPAVEFVSEWQEDAAEMFEIKPQNAYESFIDVDGEYLIERLLFLARLAIRIRESIVFQ